jgi:hypothetical protein
LLLPADEGSTLWRFILFHEKPLFKMHDVYLRMFPQIETSSRILCIGLNTRKRIFGRKKKLSQF